MKQVETIQLLGLELKLSLCVFPGSVSVCIYLFFFIFPLVKVEGEEL